jgi:hypothetical protein
MAGCSVRRSFRFAAPPYGEWFCTESELRAAMSGRIRNIGTRYYCEAKLIGCSECEVDERAKVISAL